MELSITGFANSGKTTLFNAITGAGIETSALITNEAKPIFRNVDVPDSRIDYLSGLFKPQKTTYTNIKYIDFIGFIKGDTKRNRAIIDLIKDSDAIVNVVRAFESGAVVHPLESVDYLRDIILFESELILMDLELVENRLNRIQEGEKKGKRGNPREVEILMKCHNILSDDIPLREVDFSSDELIDMRHLQFASIKPELIVINTDENSSKEEMTEITERVKSEFIKNRRNIEVITLCAKIESEIAQLQPDERALFLREMNIDKPALSKLIESSYNLLDVISFITVGEDEVRAWSIRKGSSAQQAAGRIHSDIEQGFIRAEVVSYSDFVRMVEEFGGRLPPDYVGELKSKHRLRLENKDYIVNDGDIINFRHAR
ncbi:MAG: DUF933 domain-containing protein [Myxococcota bacterium]